MDANQSIVEFNAQQIATNKALINGDLNHRVQSLLVMQKIIKANKSAMASLEKNVKNNRKRMADLMSKSEKMLKH